MRRPRENLRDAILEAAKKLFLRHGYENSSMRKIAKEVDISATTIYLYYQDKADIMHALHQEGFKLLSAQFKTLLQVEHPFERLKAMGRVYINFALENRDFYEIMFIMKEPLQHLESAEECDPGWEEGDAAFQALLTVVQACQDQGYFKGYDLYNLALLIWANMHGLCALKNNGHLALLMRKLDEKAVVSQVMQESFDMYAQMIERI